MPIKDKDVKAFFDQVVSEGGLTADEQKLLDSLMGKESVEKVFKSGVHARSLTSRQLDDLRQQKIAQEKDYSRKIGELDTLRQTLTVTSSADVQKVSALQQTIAEREQQLTRLYNTIQGYNGGEMILEEAGMTSLNFNAPPSNVNRPASQPAINKEDLIKEINESFGSQAQLLAKLPFDLMQFDREYHRLTGKNLDPSEFYEKVLADGSGDYKKVFLTEYDIPNLRIQKDQEAFDARVQKQVDEKLQEELSRRLSPSNSATGRESEFFNAVRGSIPEAERDNTPSPMGVNDRNAIVSEAVAEYQRQKAGNSG
jgi:hypothetical protein